MKNANAVDEAAVDPKKLQEQINLVKYKRALARRNFIKNVSLAGAGIILCGDRPAPVDTVS